MRNYIAYGSNINLEQMAKRCPGSKVLGKSVIEDYKLMMYGREDEFVAATIKPFEGSSVPVLVWQVDEADEKSLDGYEGWPDWYRKEDMEVEVNGEVVKAFVYLINEEGRQLMEPSETYYNTIKGGYEAVGFDVKVLDEAVEYSK